MALTTTNNDGPVRYLPGDRGHHGKREFRPQILFVLRRREQRYSHWPWRWTRAVSLSSPAPPLPPICRWWATPCVTTGAGTAQQGFVALIDPSLYGGDSLIYSTYLGGTDGNESGNGIAVDTSGNIYVIGTTRSTDFPLTDSGYAQALYGAQDAFLCKIDLNRPRHWFTPHTWAANCRMTAARSRSARTVWSISRRAPLHPVPPRRPRLPADSEGRKWTSPSA